MTKSHPGNTEEEWRLGPPPWSRKQWPAVTTQPDSFIFTGNGHCLHLHLWMLIWNVGQMGRWMNSVEVPNICKAWWLRHKVWMKEKWYQPLTLQSLSSGWKEEKLPATELHPLIGKAISWSQMVGLDAKPRGTLRKRVWAGAGKIGYESQVWCKTK